MKPSHHYHICSRTKQLCDSSIRCCSDSDTCVTSVTHDNDGSLVRISTCRNLREEIMTLQPRLDRGEHCSDSRECKDLCCREYRMHRHKPTFRCGPQRDSIMTHTCITSGN